MVTPFLKSLNTNGGTLYVFPSVSLDLTKTFVSNDYEFKFSHFACLNIPDIYSGNYTDDSDYSDKGLYLETFDYKLDNWTSDGMGKAIAEHLQNYVMNFETGILNGEGDNDDYDNNIMTTVSEKVFFNWLRKVGAIQFNDTDTEEVYTNLSDRTVQYIGDIDVTNTVEVNGDSFEELYIHIPSSVGASTTVKFRTGDLTDDKNYLDKEYLFSGDDETCIIGRSGVENPYGLSTEPIVDEDDGGNIYIGDIGHTIDFRDSSYADGDGISTMNSESSENFEFNAVLIYYDFCEKQTSTSNTKNVYTNLYGILFLDNVLDAKGGTDGTDNTNNSYKQGYLQRYPKKKETVYGNGNSFALKVDLKIDTIPDSTCTVEKYTDPNNVVSMSLYEKAIVQLQKCIDMFYEQKSEIISLKERLDSLELVFSGVDTINDLRNDIDRLYNLYDGIGTTDTSSILSLVELNTQKLNSIINGKSNIKLQYDTDVIKSGTGINLSKSTNSVIINADQCYVITPIYTDTFMDTEINSDNPLDTSTLTKACYINLKSGKNLADLYIKDGGDSASDINVYINDDTVNWVAGQSFKLHLNIDGALNFTNSSTDGIVININSTTITITGDELGDKTLIEIICTGDDKYIYIIG